jgi:hypothetical protein
MKRRRISNNFRVFKPIFTSQQLGLSTKTFQGLHKHPSVSHVLVCLVSLYHFYNLPAGFNMPPICRGFVRAFPTVPGSKHSGEVAGRVCQLLRHGLFHEAFVKAGIVLTSQEHPIVETRGIISINAARFFDAVAAAVNEVCAEIRSADKEAPVRRSFDEYWSRKEAEHANKLEAMVTPEVEYPPALGTSTLAPIVPSRFVKKM